MKDKLRPCPFCGGPAKLTERKKYYEKSDPRAVFIIECDSPCDMKYVSTGEYDDRQACIDAWNKRGGKL